MSVLSEFAARGRHAETLALGQHQRARRQIVERIGRSDRTGGVQSKPFGWRLEAISAADIVITKRATERR